MSSYTLFIPLSLSLCVVAPGECCALRGLLRYPSLSLCSCPSGVWREGIKALPVAAVLVWQGLGSASELLKYLCRCRDRREG